MPTIHKVIIGNKLG